MISILAQESLREVCAIEQHSLDEYESEMPRWCKGCGDHGVLAALQRVLRTNNLEPENVVSVSGIGCSKGRGRGVVVAIDFAGNALNQPIDALPVFSLVVVDQQGAGQLEANYLWDQHAHGLAQHRGLGLDATYAPAHDPQTIDHGRV